jgi:hypothetical protein
LYSFQTLHDFVSNLLNDEVAKAAYAADPLGALADAGLGDLTPQDVEEVIPLVTDALPTDVPLVGDLVDLDVDTLTNDLGANTGVSAIGEVEDLAYGGVLANHDAGDTDLWLGAQSIAGRVAGVVQTDDGLVSGGISTPAVYAGANSNADYLVTTADPAELLDDLGGGTSSAAATATTLIGTGAGSLNDALGDGADKLAGFLAGTPAAGVVETGADTVADAIGTGAGAVNHAVEKLPSTDDLPVDHLPVDLPDVPDIEGNLHDLPHVGDLDLPAQLPDLPVELPELGVDTSSVTDLVSSSPVADVVSNSPVGGLTDHVSGNLPVVGDVTDDLNLGL